VCRCHGLTRTADPTEVVSPKCRSGTLNGVSTRSVDALVAALGVDTGISKSEVSRICAGLDERVAAFRNRTLGHTEFPYVYLDATYVHVRDDALGQVVSRAANDQAAIRLIGAVLADQHEEWAIARRYMSDTSMAELTQPRDTDHQPQLEG
jgi:transposase-like protein